LKRGASFEETDFDMRALLAGKTLIQGCCCALRGIETVTGRTVTPPPRA